MQKLLRGTVVSQGTRYQDEKSTHPLCLLLVELRTTYHTPVLIIKSIHNLLRIISFSPVRNDHLVVAAITRHLSTSSTYSMNSHKISQVIIPFIISRSVGHTSPCRAPERERLVLPNLLPHWSWKWRSSISYRYSSSTAQLMSFWIVRCKDSCLVDHKMPQYLVD